MYRRNTVSVSVEDIHDHSITVIFLPFRHSLLRCVRYCINFNSVLHSEVRYWMWTQTNQHTIPQPYNTNRHNEAKKISSNCQLFCNMSYFHQIPCDFYSVRWIVTYAHISPYANMFRIQQHTIRWKKMFTTAIISLI